MTKNQIWVAALCTGAAWVGIATNARADALKACGGVFIDGSASCEVRKKEECMTQCTKEKVVTSCVAKLYNDCESSCTASASTTCETSCTDTCTNDCDTEMDSSQPPNCMGLCMSDCQQDCETGDGPQRGCCAHNCHAKCDEQCKDEPKEAVECKPTCTKACSGSCVAQANIDCQYSCQQKVYVDCEDQLVEHCKTECDTTGAAIFCDGQFLNSDNLDECADELDASVNIHLDVNIETVDCKGDSCDDEIDAAKKKVDDICSVANVGGGNGGTPGMGFLLLASATGVVLFRTRRRKH